MHEENIIVHLRRFFLEQVGEAQRYEYADSLPEEIRKTLLDFEKTFIQDGVKSDGVLQLLGTYHMDSFKKEISEVQTSFYLIVNERADEQPHDEDHVALINSGNSSYSFLTDDKFENDLETILRFKDREAIREKVTSFERQRIALADSHKKSNSPFVIIRPLLKYASLAVAASLALIIWQPFHEGNSDLFNNYISTNEQIEFPESDDRIEAYSKTNPNDVTAHYDKSMDGGSRGTRYSPSRKPLSRKRRTPAGSGESTSASLQSLSEIEKTKAAEAYSLFMNKTYKTSAQAFSDLGISPVKGQQFLIYLAISQLHTNELEKAKNNLLSVLAAEDTIQHDSALFYLGLYYLKIEDRNEARQRLKILAVKPGKYQNEAQAILQKMRWF